MKINVAAELKLAGKTVSRRIEEDYCPIDLGLYKHVFSAPLRVEISSVYDGEGVNVEGVLSSELLMNCTKCNKEISKEFSVQFSERFIRASDEDAEEQECYAFSGEELDLDRLLLDLIVLNAPVYAQCKPDCRGLCPVCGQDLNITQCSCSSSPKRDELAPLLELAQLLKDEEEV